MSNMVMQTVMPHAYAPFVHEDVAAEVRLLLTSAHHLLECLTNNGSLDHFGVSPKQHLAGARSVTHTHHGLDTAAVHLQRGPVRRPSSSSLSTLSDTGSAGAQTRLSVICTAAGSCARTLAQACIYPLDTIKCRLQVRYQQHRSPTYTALLLVALIKD